MPWYASSWNATSSGGIGVHQGPSKHARQLYDVVRDKTVITGGDRSNENAGCPNIYMWTNSGGFVLGSTTGSTPVLVMPTTGSTGAPPYSPSYPDNCTWVYSSVLDVYAIARSFWFTLKGTELQPTRSTGDWISDNLFFNPSSSSKFGIPGKCYSSFSAPTPDPFWGGDSHSNFGSYDPVQNAMVRCIWTGQFDLQIIPLGDLVTFPLATRYTVGQGHPSGSYLRGFFKNADPHARQSAIDVVGRKVYVVAQSQVVQSTADHGWGLIEIDLNNPTLPRKIDLPPMVTFENRGLPANNGEVVFRPQIWPWATDQTGGVDYLLAFDHIRRQLMFPQIIGYGGEVYNTLIYDLATSAWSVVNSNSAGLTSTGPWPVGNVFSFDPVAACGLLTGGHGNDQPMINHPTITVETTWPGHAFKLLPGNTVTTSVASTGSPNFTNAHVTAITGPVNVTSSITGGKYRYNVYDGATSSFIATVDSASPLVKTADFTGLIIGKNYKFTGEHRTGADTGPIGGSTGVVTRYATLSGVPISTSSASGLDVNPPVVTILYPKTSDTVSGIISLQYTATDTEGIARTEIRMNNVVIPSPVFDTRNLISGVAVNSWDVTAVDLQGNVGFNQSFFNVSNVTTPDPLPTSTSDGVQAIFLNPTIPGRVGYVLWATCPSGEEIPRAGFRSAWPNANALEVASLEAGTTRERSGTMKIEGTDDQMKARLEARWAEFNAEVQDLPDWTLEDNFWNGTGWVSR